MYNFLHPDPKTSTRRWVEEGRRSSPALLACMETDRSDRKAANGYTCQLESRYSDKQ
jgi:hypothetical protein